MQSIQTIITERLDKMSKSSTLQRHPLNMPADIVDGSRDPVLSLHRKWSDACATWERLAAIPGNENSDALESKVAELEEAAAFEAMIETPPTSLAGIAVLASVLWEMEGPSGTPGSEEYQKQADGLSCKLILAIWRAASGGNGLPRPLSESLQGRPE